MRPFPERPVHPVPHGVAAGADHLAEVKPSPEIVRVEELLARPAEPVGSLLHDPVLDPSLVADHGPDLEEEQRPDCQDHPDGQPEPEEDDDEAGQGEDDLGLLAGAVVVVPGLEGQEGAVVLIGQCVQERVGLFQANAKPYYCL